MHNRTVSRVGFNVLLADMDTSQKTTYRWSKRRKEAGIKPALDVQSFERVSDAKKESGKYDFIVFDGLPSTGDNLSSKKTNQMANM